MSDDREYTRVPGRLVEIRQKAVLFSVGRSVPRAAWIARSNLHPEDSAKLDSRFVSEEITLRIVSWKASECGFEGTRDDNAAAGDLFGDLR